MKVRVKRIPDATLKMVFVFTLSFVALIACSAPATSKDSTPKSPANATVPRKDNKPMTKPVEKVQVLVHTGRGASRTEVSDALKEVQGQVVDTTSDGTNTYYLVEIDKATYNESRKKLTENKNIQSVELNKGYKAQAHLPK